MDSSSSTDNMFRKNSTRWMFALFLGVSIVLMIGPLTHKYLYADETWFIRSNPYSFDTLGRPLIRYPFMLGIAMWDAWGIHAITLSRCIGTALLAASGLLLYVYLRGFGYWRSIAALIAIGMMALPGFLILPASVFQIEMATVAAIGAGVLLGPVVRQTRVTRWLVARLALALVLCAVALCTYQISIMLVVVMLMVPMWTVAQHERRKIITIVAIFALLFCVVLLYYLIWKSTFTSTSSPMDARYGPDAASLSTLIKNLQKFPGDRFVPVANIWYAGSLDRTLIFYISCLVVAAAMILLVVRERAFGLAKVVVFIALIPLSDIFRLVAPKVPSYVSIHSISAAWWLLVALSVISILGRHANRVLIPAVLFGVCLGTWQVTAFAVRNGNQFAAVNESLRARPLTRHIHVIGVAEAYSGLREFGDTSGNKVWLIRGMAQSISLAAGIRLTAMAGSLPKEGMPWSTYGNYCGRPDLLIRLPSPSHQCAGTGCIVPDEEVDQMTWPHCGRRI